MKKLLLIFLLFSGISSHAQIASIDTLLSPKGKIKYDTTYFLNVQGTYIRKIDSTTLGFDSSKVVTDITKVGDSFYVYKGGILAYKLKDSTGGGSAGWGLLGNTGTTVGTNFIGNTDSVDLAIKVANTYAGYVSVTGGTHTRSLTALGFKAGNPGSSTGINNSAFGPLALASLTTGIGNMAIGANALNINTTGNYNVAIGFDNLSSNISGVYNTAVGAGSLKANTGSYNNSIGYALHSNTSGVENVGVGYLALNANTTHDGSTAVGTGALQSATARYNSALGYWAMRLTTTGEINTGVGYTALYNNSSGSYNTAIGWGAGSFNTTASQQIFIDAVPRTSYSENQTQTPIYVQASNSSYLTTQKITLNGKVGINTIAPDASATLDISSTTQGVLLSRMTTTQRTAISSPAEGLMVYDLTLHKLYVYDGTTWQAAW